MSPFLQLRIVLRPRNTPLPSVMPRVARALGVETAVVVDDHVVADEDLVRMPQHDVHAERDVAADPAEHQRIELRAQEQAERARHPAAEQHRELVAHAAATSRPAR